MQKHKLYVEILLFSVVRAQMFWRGGCGSDSVFLKHCVAIFCGKLIQNFHYFSSCTTILGLGAITE